MLGTHRDPIPLQEAFPQTVRQSSPFTPDSALRLVTHLLSGTMSNGFYCVLSLSFNNLGSRVHVFLQSHFSWMTQPFVGFCVIHSVSGMALGWHQGLSRSLKSPRGWYLADSPSSGQQEPDRTACGFASMTDAHSRTP